MANACSIKMNNPKMAVDRRAGAGHEVCNNAKFCAHHTDDGLCRVAVPPSNKHVLSILKLISSRRLSNIFKIPVHFPGFNNGREG